MDRNCGHECRLRPLPCVVGARSCHKLSRRPGSDPAGLSSPHATTQSLLDRQAATCRDTPAAGASATTSAGTRPATSRPTVRSRRTEGPDGARSTGATRSTRPVGCAAGTTTNGVSGGLLDSRPTPALTRTRTSTRHRRESRASACRSVEPPCRRSRRSHSPADPTCSLPRRKPRPRSSHRHGG